MLCLTKSSLKNRLLFVYNARPPYPLIPRGTTTTHGTEVSSSLIFLLHNVQRAYTCMHTSTKAVKLSFGHYFSFWRTQTSTTTMPSKQPTTFVYLCLFLASHISPFHPPTPHHLPCSHLTFPSQGSLHSIPISPYMYVNVLYVLCVHVGISAASERGHAQGGTWGSRASSREVRWNGELERGWKTMMKPACQAGYVRRGRQGGGRLPRSLAVLSVAFITSTTLTFSSLFFFFVIIYSTASSGPNLPTKMNVNKHRSRM